VSPVSLLLVVVIVTTGPFENLVTMRDERVIQRSIMALQRKTRTNFPLLRRTVSPVSLLLVVVIVTTGPFENLVTMRDERVIQSSIIALQGMTRTNFPLLRRTVSPASLLLLVVIVMTGLFENPVTMRDERAIMALP
jgi:hypothetical protein